MRESRMHSQPSSPAQTPGDAFDEPGAVAGGCGFTEDFGEALPQLADGQALEGGDLVEDVQFHRVLLWLVGETVNPCGQLASSREKLKVIRDKKERFLRREKWRAEVEFVGRVPSGKEATGG